MKKKKPDFDPVSHLNSIHKFICDSNNNVYAVQKASETGGIAERIDSKAFKDYAASEYYRYTQMVPTESTIDSAIRVVKAQAIQKGDKREIYIRSAPLDGKSGIAIDIGLDDGRVLIIAPEDVKIDKADVLFWRPQGQKALPFQNASGCNLSNLFSRC